MSNQTTQRFSANKRCMLQLLDLANNKLTGTIPETIGNLTNMTDLLLFDNKLSGTLPSTMEKLVKLIEIDLNNNDFSGSLPDWIGTNTSIQYLSMANCRFTGTIPTTFVRDWDMHGAYVNIEYNFLVGPIPTNLATYISTSSFTLQYYASDTTKAGQPYSIASD